MARKSLFEELTITIEKGELARLLGAAEGFTVDMVQDEKTNVVFSLIRNTDVEEKSLIPVESEDLFERGGSQ